MFSMTEGKRPSGDCPDFCGRRPQEWDCPLPRTQPKTLPGVDHSSIAPRPMRIGGSARCHVSGRNARLPKRTTCTGRVLRWLVFCQICESGCHAHACVGMPEMPLHMPTQAWAWHPSRSLQARQITCVPCPTGLDALTLLPVASRLPPERLLRSVVRVRLPGRA